MKNNKGITLIALVITIIVLLILAGISIAMLTGNNGLLTKANDAKSETSKAEVIERINMELNAAYADVLSGDISSFSESYVSAINTNLTVDGKKVATAAADTATKKILTITAEDADLGISAGKITIPSDGTVAEITAAK